LTVCVQVAANGALVVQDTAALAIGGSAATAVSVSGTLTTQNTGVIAFNGSTTFAAGAAVNGNGTVAVAAQIAAQGALALGDSTTQVCCVCVCVCAQMTFWVSVCAGCVHDWRARHSFDDGSRARWRTGVASAV
jgi:hypothetical protein